MRVLGLDFETTFTDPIDPKQALITEAGCVLWDTDTKQPLVMYSALCWSPKHVFDPRMTELCGFTEGQIMEFGKPPVKVLENVLRLITMCDVIAAHNGTNFDKPVLEAECARHGLLMPGGKLSAPDVPWIDTCTDIPYPKKIETRKLDFLGPAHGFLNPFAHRALFDVCTMLKVLSHYDIAGVCARASTPKVQIRAVTKKPWEDGGKSNQAAKDRGYRFNGDSKTWLKTVLETEVAQEQKDAPFQTEVLK